MSLFHLIIHKLFRFHVWEEVSRRRVEYWYDGFGKSTLEDSGEIREYVCPECGAIWEKEFFSRPSSRTDVTLRRAITAPPPLQLVKPLRRPAHGC